MKSRDHLANDRTNIYSVFSTNLYQYTKVFQRETSTFIYTNKFNQ